jgi:hypothetical protein
MILRDSRIARDVFRLTFRDEEFESPDSNFFINSGSKFTSKIFDNI